MNNWNTRVTLLEKIRDRHDETSWEDFVYYYKQYIYVVVRGMNLNHHDAEEIVQMVLLKVWDKLPEFNYDSEKGRFRLQKKKEAKNACDTKVGGSFSFYHQSRYSMP